MRLIGCVLGLLLATGPVWAGSPLSPLRFGEPSWFQGIDQPMSLTITVAPKDHFGQFTMNGQTLDEITAPAKHEERFGTTLSIGRSVSLSELMLHGLLKQYQVSPR